jgi:hypothetical protein
MKNVAYKGISMFKENVIERQRFRILNIELVVDYREK